MFIEERERYERVLSDFIILRHILNPKKDKRRLKRKYKRKNSIL